MLAANGPIHDPNSLTWVVILVATGAVIFWQTVAKVLIAVAVALVALGALEVLRSLH